MLLPLSPSAWNRLDSLPMSKDLIRYDLLVQDALKGVVRKLLIDAARDGLPGDHHFYVSFRTPEPGVRLSQRMREKYPEEMTVVLQHQFWDLNVTEHSFEVGLSFGGVPERLLVPFDAVTGFFDPSVQFGLKFEVKSAEAAVPEADTPLPPHLSSVPAPKKPGGEESHAPAPSLRKTPAKLAKGEEEPAPLAAEKADKAKKPSKDVGEAAAPEMGKPSEPGQGKDAGKPSPKSAGEREPAPETGAQVVSLDAFRKKT